MAYLTNWLMDRKSSFRMMLVRCVSAVFTLISRVAATSLFVFPSARSCTIWRSRGVRRTLFFSRTGCGNKRPLRTNGRQEVLEIVSSTSTGSFCRTATCVFLLIPLTVTANRHIEKYWRFCISQTDIPLNVSYSHNPPKHKSLSVHEASFSLILPGDSIISVCQTSLSLAYFCAMPVSFNTTTF